MGVCNCSLFCCTLLYVHSSIAIILMGKRELIALLNLSSWCLVMVERLFLAVPQGCLQFMIVVFPDHTHLLFFTSLSFKIVQYTLYVTGDKVMPLYDSGSLGSLVEAFGIGFIIPLVQVSGIFPDSKHTLKNLCRNAFTLAFFKT